MQHCDTPARSGQTLDVPGGGAAGASATATLAPVSPSDPDDTPAYPGAVPMALRIAPLLPGDRERVFFSEAGSVAVEIAMKMAVQYWLNHGIRGRNRFVAFRGGYHGDTTGAMAVGDPEGGMHGLFAGL